MKRRWNWLRLTRIQESGIHVLRRTQEVENKVRRLTMISLVLYWRRTSSVGEWLVRSINRAYKVRRPSVKLRSAVDRTNCLTADETVY